MRRDETGSNGPVQFFFAPIFGHLVGESSATAVAVVDDRVLLDVGFDPGHLDAAGLCQPACFGQCDPGEIDGIDTPTFLGEPDRIPALSGGEIEGRFGTQVIEIQESLVRR